MDVYVLKSEGVVLYEGRNYEIVRKWAKRLRKRKKLCNIYKKRVDNYKNLCYNVYTK